MDSSHYQVHSDRIIPKNNIKPEFLSCNICKNILWQPEKCKDCHTHYCRFCILFSLLKSKKCPTCFSEYTSKSPDTFLLEDLTDLNVKCFYSYNCDKKIVTYIKHFIQLNLLFKRKSKNTTKHIPNWKPQRKLLGGCQRN